MNLMIVPGMLVCSEIRDVFGCGCCFVGGGALLDINRVWSSTEWVCCACDPSVHLSVPPYVLFVFLHVGSYLLI